jgi:hypothetical protein
MNSDLAFASIPQGHAPVGGFQGECGHLNLEIPTRIPRQH